MKTMIIDAGTTNTRVVLLDEAGTLIGTERQEAGVRDTAIDGHNGKLKAAVRGCMERLLEKNGLTFDDVSCVLASGMITSNVGLCEVPHLTAPVGAKELAEGITPRLLPDVCPKEICFIPGIKNHADAVTADNFEAMDIMRGEEVEAVALIRAYHKGEPMVLVLPGSHTKFVAVDKEGKITGCLTAITGELLSVITNNTILADAAEHQFVRPENYDKEMLLCGYRNAKKVGLGRAAFSARILSQFQKPGAQRIANYLLGAVLEGDVRAILHSDAVRADENTTLVVCGKAPLQRAICDCLADEGAFKEIVSFSDDDPLPLSARGARIVGEMAGRIG